NGQPVRSIVSVDWQVNPQKTGAIVSFVVVPSETVPAGQMVKVEAQMLPPEDARDQFGSIRGRARTLAAVGRQEQRVLVAPARGPVKYYVNEGDRVQAGQLLAEVDGKPYLDEYRKAVEVFNSIQVQLNQAAQQGAGARYVTREQVDAIEVQKASLTAQILKL
ncbi:MAG: hypothetical protein HQL18_02540, partial [Candidatus Omnitrophica bacterium]|nr:hypothetical protein [Candidatus Omnitrophota bacterium]